MTRSVSNFLDRQLECRDRTDETVRLVRRQTTVQEHAVVSFRIPEARAEGIEIHRRARSLVLLVPAALRPDAVEAKGVLGKPVLMRCQQAQRFIRTEADFVVLVADLRATPRPASMQSAELEREDQKVSRGLLGDALVPRSGLSGQPRLVAVDIDEVPLHQDGDKLVLQAEVRMHEMLIRRPVVDCAERLRLRDHTPLLCELVQIRVLSCELLNEREVCVRQDTTPELHLLQDACWLVVLGVLALLSILALLVAVGQWWRSEVTFVCALHFSDDPVDREVAPCGLSSQTRPDSVELSHVLVRHRKAHLAMRHLESSFSFRA